MSVLDFLGNMTAPWDPLGGGYNVYNATSPVRGNVLYYFNSIGVLTYSQFTS